MEERSEAAAALLAADGRSVVIVEPLPMPPVDDQPITCLSRGGDPDGLQLRGPATGVESRGVPVGAGADRADAIVTVDADELVCPGYPTCPAVVDGVVRMGYESHLTATYARSLAPGFADLLVEAGVIDRP